MRALPAAVAAGVVLPLLAIAATTAPSEAGPGASAEVLINTTTFDAQTAPDIASDAVGDYVVTWTSYGQDGSASGVYAQRYNAAGTARGVEGLVNTTTSASQRQPSVAMDADGDYVIAWTSYDGDSDGIYVQRYNAAGVAQGIETRVNTTTVDSQNDPQVAIDASGDYVVVWTSGQDGSSEGVYSQRYNAAGAPQGVQTLVNTTTSNVQFEPSVAMDADADYVVTWTSSLQDGGGTGIYAQRYKSAGAAQGVETLVNTTTVNDQRESSVAMDAVGDYVVTWTSTAQEPGNGIYAQRFDAGGVRQGNETHVNTTTGNDQVDPHVARAADDDYVVTWTSVGQDGSGRGIYAQTYTDAGSPQGSETRVNTTTADDQDQPAVAMDADGDYVVAWSSDAQDGSVAGVYGRRFRGPESVDLRLSQTDNADPIAVGGRLVYRIRVTNHNDPATDTGVAAIDSAIGAVTGARVLITPPDGAELTSYSGSGWTCGSPRATFSCQFDTPLAAEDVAPTLVLVYDAPPSGGTIEQSATVSDRHTDPVNTDNTEVERTGVQCTLEFASPSYSKSEFSPVTATVTRRGTDCGTSSVHYHSASGTAISGSDFTGVAGILTWTDADVEKTFNVPLVDDTLDEANERFTLDLDSPSGALLGANDLVTAYVGDNDDPPRINFTTTSATAAEPGALVDVVLRLSEISGQSVSVKLSRSGTATFGADYFAPTKTTIPAGQRSVEFTVEVADDALIEGAETAILTLTSPVEVALGSLKTFKLTITSNE